MGKLKAPSEAEKRVLLELLSDKAVKEAAASLNISFDTAQTHSASIKKKAGTRNLHAAVFRLMHHNLIPPDDLKRIPIVFPED